MKGFILFLLLITALVMVFVDPWHALFPIIGAIMLVGIMREDAGAG